MPPLHRQRAEKEKEYCPHYRHCAEEDTGHHQDVERKALTPEDIFRLDGKRVVYEAESYEEGRYGKYGHHLAPIAFGHSYNSIHISISTAKILPFSKNPKPCAI